MSTVQSCFSTETYYRVPRIPGTRSASLAPRLTERTVANLGVFIYENPTRRVPYRKRRNVAFRPVTPKPEKFT